MTDAEARFLRYVELQEVYAPHPNTIRSAKRKGWVNWNKFAQCYVLTIHGYEALRKLRQLQVRREKEERTKILLDSLEGNWTEPDDA